MIWKEDFKFVYSHLSKGIWEKNDDQPNQLSRRVNENDWN